MSIFNSLTQAQQKPETANYEYLNEDVHRFYEASRKFDNELRVIEGGLYSVHEKLGELDLNQGISKRWKEFSSLLESLKAIEDT